MNFARYKGPQHEGVCEFIPGRIYFADNRIEGSDACDLETFDIEDECGKARRIKIPSPEWEFLQEVYAVVVHGSDGFTESGQVVVLDGLEDDGNLKVSVKGYGLRMPSDVSILDVTTIYPGMSVRDESTNYWKRIESIDEAMWISVGGGLRSPEEFSFAVSKGDILSSPIMVCCNSQLASRELTEGNYYIPICTFIEDGRISHLIVNDRGEEKVYDGWHFEM